MVRTRFLIPIAVAALLGRAKIVASFLAVDFQRKRRENI
jgi:hypothetical protein